MWVAPILGDSAFFGRTRAESPRNAGVLLWRPYGKEWPSRCHWITSCLPHHSSRVLKRGNVLGESSMTLPREDICIVRTKKVTPTTRNYDGLPQKDRATFALKTPWGLGVPPNLPEDAAVTTLASVIHRKYHVLSGNAVTLKHCFQHSAFFCFTKNCQAASVFCFVSQNLPARR